MFESPVPNVAPAKDDIVLSRAYVCCFMHQEAIVVLISVGALLENHMIAP